MHFDRIGLIAVLTGCVLISSVHAQDGPLLLPPRPSTSEPTLPTSPEIVPPSGFESPSHRVDHLLALRPQGKDFSRPSLERFYAAFEETYGPTYRDVPLEAKAELYEWALERYHWTPWDQVLPRVILSDDPNAEIGWHQGADISTWNGALLAALSYKYAVTREPETLEKIARLLRGLHLFLKVTDEMGLPARCVMKTKQGDVNRQFIDENGEEFWFRSDAAKGTLNQIVGGFAVMMLLAYPDLPPEVQAQARFDLQEMAYHLIRHDYKLTERDGKHTKYGNLTPRVGSTGVPFNAQVAYSVIATATIFEGPDEGKQRKILKHMQDLRGKHHVYYESPLRHIILPQRIGASPFVKGMNDRNHVCNAAYIGLFLERYDAVKNNRPLDSRLCYELGRTMYWTLRELENHRNALINFQWAGILNDRELFPRVLKEGEYQQTVEQVGRLHADGMEQLRRFPINRFGTEGEEAESPTPLWVDARKRHDAYLWKSDAFQAWQSNGQTTPTHIASIDFLHAYWLMRYWGLDR